MKKISVIGLCGKAATMSVDHFHEKGETLIADSLFEEIGGKGLNQAIAASRMGAEVSFLAAVGDDENGRECAKVIKENNVKGFLKVKERTTVAFILVDKLGENRVTEFEGSVLTKEDVLSFEDEISTSDILLLQHEVPTEVNEEAVKIAKKHNVRVILNPAPINKVSDSVAENVWIVTPNEQERQAIDIKRFKNCITTLGEKGCSINDEEFVPAIETRTVDTTGAGDTFNGVLAVCLAEGMSLKDSSRYAVAASGISVGIKGVLNAIPKREEIEEKIL